MGLATILRAFCCGIAAFMMNLKYADVPGSHVNHASRLQGQDSTMEDLDRDLVNVTIVRFTAQSVERFTIRKKFKHVRKTINYI